MASRRAELQSALRPVPPARRRTPARSGAGGRWRRRNRTRSSRAIDGGHGVDAADEQLSVSCAIMAASSTTVTRPRGVVDGAERRHRAGRDAQRFAASGRPSRTKTGRWRRAAGAATSGRSRRPPARSPGTARPSCPCRNRFLVWPPGIVPRSACDLLDREQRRVASPSGGRCRGGRGRRKDRRAWRAWASA